MEKGEGNEWLLTTDIADILDAPEPQAPAPEMQLAIGCGGATDYIR
jgi:hypothetical protein